MSGVSPDASHVAYEPEYVTDPNLDKEANMSEQTQPADSLVQVSKVTGRITRVKPGNRPPVVELQLGDHQRVISMKLTEDWLSRSQADRVTTDWSWTAYIETRLST